MGFCPGKCIEGVSEAESPDPVPITNECGACREFAGLVASVARVGSALFRQKLLEAKHLNASRHALSNYSVAMR